MGRTRALPFLLFVFTLSVVVVNAYYDYKKNRQDLSNAKGVPYNPGGSLDFLKGVPYERDSEDWNIHRRSSWDLAKYYREQQVKKPQLPGHVVVPTIPSPKPNLKKESKEDEGEQNYDVEVEEQDSNKDEKANKDYDKVNSAVSSATNPKSKKSAASNVVSGQPDSNGNVLVQPQLADSNIGDKLSLNLFLIITMPPEMRAAGGEFGDMEVATETISNK